MALSGAAGGPLLALDTSGPTASVGLVTGDACWERLVSSQVMRSEAVVDTLDALRAETHLRWAQVAALVVGLGPGSFTGIRVGLATAKGIALGASVPVYGVSSLAMLALTYGPGPVGVALDARRGQLFTAVYSRREGELVPDATRSPNEALAAFGTIPLGAMVGDRAASVSPSPQLPLHEQPAPRALWGLWWARDRIRRGQADDLAALAPRYLRLSEPELKAAERGGA